MTRGPLIVAGMFMGAGLGGLLDGIVLSEILQLHGMLSAVVPPDNLENLQVNMRWGGYRHIVCWTMDAVGIAALWVAAKRVDVPWSGRTLWGSLLAGWGVFNVLEQLIDHELLGLHHMVERLGASTWDYVYLGSGVLLAVIGLALVESARRRPLAELTDPPPVSE